MSLKYHQLDSSVEKQIKENISKGILSPYRFMDENACAKKIWERTKIAFFVRLLDVI